MISTWIKLSVYFVLLILVQVLILNHISFLDHATPYLYIYFIIKLPIGSSRYFTIFLGFLLGFIIDLFCNTPGQNAAATTFAAFMLSPVQGLFFSKEDYSGIVPSMANLRSNFMKYAILIVLIHHTILISIATFSYIDPLIIILRIISSAMLTSILIFALEGFSLRKKRYK